jgi:hypothetical protein
MKFLGNRDFSVLDSFRLGRSLALPYLGDQTFAGIE